MSKARGKIGRRVEGLNTELSGANVAIQRQMKARTKQYEESGREHTETQTLHKLALSMNTRTAVMSNTERSETRTRNGGRTKRIGVSSHHSVLCTTYCPVLWFGCSPVLCKRVQKTGCESQENKQLKNKLETECLKRRQISKANTAIPS